MVSLCSGHQDEKGGHLGLEVMLRSCLGHDEVMLRSHLKSAVDLDVRLTYAHVDFGIDERISMVPLFLL